MNERPDKSKTAREPRRKVLGVSLEAFEEIKMIYDAWLGYLLGMLGADTLRIKADDIHKCLGEYVLSARREGDEYVVSILHRPVAPAEGSVGDPAPSEEESHE